MGSELVSELIPDASEDGAIVGRCRTGRGGAYWRK